MPTDTQVETARRIFDAAKPPNKVTQPEPAPAPPRGDQSKAATLLADLNARNIRVLEEAGALPKYPREQNPPPPKGETTPPEASPPAQQEDITPKLLTQGGQIQEVHKVAVGNLARTLQEMQKMGTKPKTGPRERT